jgi:hypothetical protein
MPARVHCPRNGLCPIYMNNYNGLLFYGNAKVWASVNRYRPINHLPVAEKPREHEVVKRLVAGPALPAA